MAQKKVSKKAPRPSRRVLLIDEETIEASQFEPERLKPFRDFTVLDDRGMWGTRLHTPLMVGGATIEEVRLYPKEPGVDRGRSGFIGTALAVDAKGVRHPMMVKALKKKPADVIQGIVEGISRPRQTDRDIMRAALRGVVDLLHLKSAALILPAGDIKTGADVKVTVNRVGRVKSERRLKTEVLELGKDSTYASAITHNRHHLNHKPAVDDQVAGKGVAEVTLLSLGDRGTPGGLLLLESRRDMGFDNTLIKGMKPLLTAVSQELVKRRMMTIDPVSYALNKRAFEEWAEKQIAANHESPDNIVYASTDLDQFKRIRGAFGHENGTRIIQQYVRVCNAVLGGEGVVGEIGGDEFLMVTWVGKEKGRELIQEVRESVAENSFHVILPKEAAGVELETSSKLGFEKEGSEVTKIYLPADSEVTENVDGSRRIELAWGVVTVSMGAACMDEIEGISDMKPPQIRAAMRKTADNRLSTAKARGRDMAYDWTGSEA